MALCIECSPAVQEVPGTIPDWDASVSDALRRGCRWPWSSPYIVATPTWCSSHAVLRFEHPAPSGAIEVRAPCSLSRYSDLHASDQIYPRPNKLSHDPQSRAGDIAAWGGASVSDALCWGCRWPWSSPYNRLIFLFACAVDRGAENIVNTRSFDKTYFSQALRQSTSFLLKNTAQILKSYY